MVDPADDLRAARCVRRASRLGQAGAVQIVKTEMAADRRTTQVGVDEQDAGA